ncbi:MAG: PilW family protein, partial [Planctomycetaceae bacterium]
DIPVIDHRRAGFTLIEMLVSAALTIIIMLMFAQVYQVAGESVAKQKGIAENDQRSRMLTTIIQNDLRSRSFKVITPFLPGETNVINRRGRGYFYYSENDPINDADDILQFTVELSGDSEPLTGRATRIGATTDVHQPEADDGRIVFPAGVPELEENRTGASLAAEVSYFLRRGNLYRRVLLLRQPLELSTNAGPDGARVQPEDSTLPIPNPLITGPYADSFWELFDYSAHHYAIDNHPLFHGVTSLTNDGSVTFPLAFPYYRFGHDHLSGNPREFVTAGGADFIGRFTHEETSHAAFDYPGSGASSPMAAGTPLTYDSSLGVVAEFVNGSRRGDDILMSNVHSFDVKLWDREYDEDANNNDILDSGEDLNRNGVLDTPPAGAPPRSAGAFADVGHAAAAGTFRHAANQLPNYGPNAPDNRVFDTWHPGVDFDDDNGDLDPANGTPDPPPFRPIAPPWTPLTPYNVGDVVEPVPPNGFYYRCVTAGTSGGPGPDSPLYPGNFEPFQEGSLGTEVTWVIEAHIPAIQITIRFYDVSSNQMRQLTLVQSLTGAN